jgi:hypothetical protein
VYRSNDQQTGIDRILEGASSAPIHATTQIGPMRIGPYPEPDHDKKQECVSQDGDHPDRGPLFPS